MSATSDPVPPDDDAADRAARRKLRRDAALEDESVPRIPRGRGFKISTGQLVKIVMTAALLIMLVMIQRPCADGVSKFVTDFDEKGSAANTMPKPGKVDRAGSGSAEHYEHIRPDMTEAERNAAIQREMARAKAASGSGSAGSAQPASDNASGSAKP